MVLLVILVVATIVCIMLHHSDALQGLGHTPFTSNIQSTYRTMSSRLLMGKGFGGKSTIQYSGALRPGKLSPKRDVPAHILRPDYALDGTPKKKKTGLPWMIPPTPAEDIAKMRVAGRYAREVLDAAVRMIRPGITTDAIDALVHAETIQRNAYPSPLNYCGYPKSCCTSINEVICHGIPDTTVLKEGDILNIDVTVYHNGVHGDCSETVIVGEKVDDKVRDLVYTTYQAWQAAIKHCRPGVPYSELGGVMEDVFAPKGYTSVKEFCGHG